MSGRPPPPCPPSAATAALTRSTALNWPARSSVTPTATLARPSLTATSAATPEPTRCFIVSTVERKSLGSSLPRPGQGTCGRRCPRALRRPPCADPPPIASAFFASASSRSSRLRSSTSAAIRAGTSSGDALQRRRRLAQLHVAVAEPLARRLPRQRLDPANARRHRAFRDDLEELDVAERPYMRAAAQLDRIIGIGVAAHREHPDLVAIFFAEQRHRPGLDRLIGSHQPRRHRLVRADVRRSPRPRPPRSPRGSAPWDARSRSGNSRRRPGCPSA